MLHINQEGTMPSYENVEQTTESTQMRDLTHEQIVATQQSEINSMTFERITSDHREAVAACDSLEAALAHARARREILGAAVDRLNEPQDTKGF
jgi:hypothetical protein